SAKWATRSPVSASTNMVGLSAASERSRSVIRGAPDAMRSTAPGKKVSISGPGLNPSSVFHSVGSMWMPSLFAGIASRGYATRKRVGVVGSERRNALEGKGRRHLDGTRKSQATAASSSAQSGSADRTAGSAQVIGVGLADGVELGDAVGLLVAVGG